MAQGALRAPGDGNAWVCGPEDTAPRPLAIPGLLVHHPAAVQCPGKKTPADPARILPLPLPSLDFGASVPHLP